jgi:hypothetical protein
VTEDIFGQIRAELERLAATTPHVQAAESVGVTDMGEGMARLDGSPVRKPPFFWVGKATEILQRLSDLPDDAGPEAIRSEFA